jgi:hypothetical protein
MSTVYYVEDYTLEPISRRDAATNYNTRMNRVQKSPRSPPLRRAVRKKPSMKKRSKQKKQKKKALSTLSRMR